MMWVIKFFLFGIGLEGLRMIDRGQYPYRGAVFFMLAVVLWFWQPILEWFLAERWRDNWRNW
jgi:hypothetical protein